MPHLIRAATPDDVVAWLDSVTAGQRDNGADGVSLTDVQMALWVGAAAGPRATG